MLALIIASVVHVRAFQFFGTYCKNPELFLCVVKELSLSKQSKEIRVYILSLGMRCAWNFYEPFIKPGISVVRSDLVKVSHVFISPLISAENYSSYTQYVN